MTIDMQGIQKSAIPGMKILLMGPPGSGKTQSVESWIRKQGVITGQPTIKGETSGIEVMCIFTEPSYDVLGGIPCEQGLHWAYLPPSSDSWEETYKTLDMVHRMDQKSLANAAFSRKDYDHPLRLAKLMNNYRCDRCSKEFGPVNSWGTNRVLHLDSLSGLNQIMMQFVVGANPMKSPGDYGIAMDQEEKILSKLCFETFCHFVLTAHLDRETDQATGKASVYPAALGNKLAPKLGRYFTDVILCAQQAGQFTWSTAAAGADLKARNLPLQDKLTPGVGQMLERWKQRGGLITDKL